MRQRKKRLITAEDLYKIEVIADVRMAPDGAKVIYTLQRVDPKTEKKYTNLWLANVDRSGSRQFTYGDHNDSRPRWSPDGSQIAFLSNRGNLERPAEIYLIQTDGGEARHLAKIDGAIGALDWSPDGKRLLCTVRKLDAEALERQQDEAKKKLGVVSRHYDRLSYKLDGDGYLPKERWHLWTIDIRSGKATQITDHAVYDENVADWSPDGRWIAFLSNRSPDPDAYRDAVDLFLMPAQGGEPRLVPTPVGGKSALSFSPDGQWIAYYGVEGEGLWYKNQSLWVVPADGSAPANNLTEGYDLHVTSMTINDVGQPEDMPPTWSVDSQRIFFPAVLHGSSLLMGVSADGQHLETIFAPKGGEQRRSKFSYRSKTLVGGVVGGFSFSRDQRKLAYFLGQIDDPCQVFAMEMETGNRQQLTNHNQRLLGGIDLGQVETHWIKGPDGNDLQGWILKPPGFDPDKKYPSILEIHGGPLTQYGYFFMHEFYYLAAQGYVVHFSNPRGGRGYGEAHAGAIWLDWGNRDYADLMAWTDYVASQPYIDAGRMGVTGGSYGGYMTVWMIGHTQRFKAAVTMRCVSNFISMWGSSDLNWSFQKHLGDKPPFEDLENYWKHSPIAYIGNARTPTLVIHNEFDLRCPIEQGEQVFVALKRLGVDTAMVRFPDEFHGLSRTGRTDRKIVRLKHISGWFDKYLK